MDIPDDIELAIIIVPNDNVLEAVKDCVEKGVKGIIIETAGFSETFSLSRLRMPDMSGAKVMTTRT